MELNINNTCCFTGHRPEKCKGQEAFLRKQLELKIKKAIKEGYTTFITGMAPGVDTWAAEEVLKIKAEYDEIKLVCAVPFNGVEKNRTPEQQERFRQIISKADDITYISKKYQRWCFYARDEWMVDHASRVIAVFNGTHGGTEYTINYAKKMERTIDFITDSELQLKIE